MVKLLTRDSILNADDLPFEDVHVPEWGGMVRVRTLTGRERDEFEAGILSGPTGERIVVHDNLRARLVSLTVVDEKGKRVFTTKDMEPLGLKSAAALDRIFSVSMRLNGLSDVDVEELVGKSADPHGDGSS